MPEPFAGEVNAEEIWDSVCTEIITSGLNARECDLEMNNQRSLSTMMIIFFLYSSFFHVDNFTSAETNSVIREAAVSAVTTPIQLCEGKRMNKERTEQCHKAVARFFVKTLQPLSTVESPWFR